MNRKLVGGGLALTVVVVGVWALVLRGGGDAPTHPAAGTGRSARIESTTPPAAKPSEAPRGRAPRWTLDRDPEGSLRLEGQVVGPDGKGVAGAIVRLASVPPRTATSDDDGTFSFDKVVGRTYTLAARTGELVGGPVTYKLTATSDPVVIHLAEGAAVEVTVVDAVEHPIAGAELRAGPSAPAVQTDAKGQATIKPVRPGYVTVAATATGYAAGGGFTTIGSAGATGRLTIHLKKGVAVSGRVVDDAGTPIARAHVTTGRDTTWAEWGIDDDDDDDDDPAEALGGATSDDKGRFTIAAVAPGTHTLNAIDGEHAPGQSLPVPVADRPVSGVEIVMKTGGTVAGVVVDTAGKPAPHATVRVAGTGRTLQGAARQAVADDHGAFELRGLARAQLSARAESDAAASKLAAVDLTDRPAVKDLQLVLDVVGVIAGKVVDDKGAPVAEVQVNAFPDVMGGASLDGVALAGMSSATTNGAGEFTIHGLPEGAYKLWAARSSAAQAWGQGGTGAKTGDRNVVITLPPAGGLAGKVALDGAVAPPKLVTVQLGFQPATPARDGAFELRDVAPGSYDVSFRGPEFATLVKRDVRIEPGKTTDLGTITVQRGRRLAGKVVDAKGQPVPGAKVKLGEMLFDLDGREDVSGNLEDVTGIRSATTDRDGGFAIIGVPTKATTVAAGHPELGRSIGVAVPEGTDDPPPVTLALRGFGSISGKVTQKGKPQGGITISVSTKGGGAQLTFANSDDGGNFKLAKVPEGTVVIQAMQTKMMAMKSTTTTVQVTAGRETKVAIDLPVGQITLTVQIKALPNHQVNAAQVFLFAGLVAPANGKQLMDSFLQGGAQGMKFWLSKDAPMPAFEELVPAEYSVCTVPITGDLNDPKFAARLNEHSAQLKVYCRQTTVAAAPLTQAVVHEVPSMTPLPAP